MPRAARSRAPKSLTQIIAKHRRGTSTLYRSCKTMLWLLCRAAESERKRVCLHSLYTACAFCPSHEYVFPVRTAITPISVGSVE
jgi:hypothetical protein